MGIARSLGLTFEYSYQKMGIVGRFDDPSQQFDKKNVIIFHIS